MGQKPGFGLYFEREVASVAPNPVFQICPKRDRILESTVADR
ncbi:hypothetical protein [Roseofilum casamattae]|uniref:Uncharacterized protein n=1 Tax=Roseofilum casamattae BLCC-M143 TaxID=3022442 RepID=A0ABT7BWN2_9CYAN|nr:hypothetical protein [Roseofilum casamattae]MDJ1182871.1 hypothetical protein [Roseofilum casamattae BLCC-M143]